MANVIIGSVLLIVMLVAALHHYVTQRRGVLAITAYVEQITASHTEISARMHEATEKIENLKKLVADRARRT